MILGFLSDAHSNIRGFEKGLDVLRSNKAEKIFFLGDAVGYFDGLAVLESLYSQDIECVLGNHDAMMLEGGVSVEKDSIYRLNQYRNSLPEYLYDYVSKWPSFLEAKFSGCKVKMFHGSPDDFVYGYVYKDTPLSELILQEDTFYFMGATHRPFIREKDGSTIVNIGSCGFPRDHGALGAVCTFDTDSQKINIFRFDISDSLYQLDRSHESLDFRVHEVMNRREPNFFGKVVK